jgi:hypothetical protein
LSEANLPAVGLSHSAAGDRAGVARFIATIDASLEKHFWRWAFLFTAVFLACSIARDLRTDLWFDELFTLHLAKLASPQEIVAVNDASPPLYPIIAQILLGITGNDALAVRLPATLGYSAMLLCLWAFCRRRLPPVYAFAAALLACERTQYYAIEGRAYGVVLGCAAAALLCWQMAAEGCHRTWALLLLACFASLMVALHYYAIFFLVPLAIADIVRWRAERRVDLGTWVAMLPAALVLAAHYALLVAGQDYQAHFWGTPSFEDVALFYARFLLPPLILCALAFVAARLFVRPSRDLKERKPSLPIHEWTALAGLAVMPPVVVVVSMYTTNAFVERYILWAVIGFAVLAGAGLCTVVRGRAAAGVALVALSLAAIVRLELRPLIQLPVLRDGEEVRRELTAIETDNAEPIVVANAHVFMELTYYLGPPIRERLVYALSRELDLKYRGYDTDALSLGPLAQRTQIAIRPYEQILAVNTRFLLAATEEDYLPQHLAAVGYRVTPVGRAKTLYQVEVSHE